MGAAILLSKLRKAKRTGSGRWMACCPAHQDRSASLSVRELDDGRVLMHCFAECPTADVLAAVGLDFSDLMPERMQGDFKPVRHAFNAWDVLKALDQEITFCQLCAIRMANAQPLSASDQERLRVAANRIKSAVYAVGGTA